MSKEIVKEFVELIEGRLALNDEEQERYTENTTYWAGAANETLAITEMPQYKALKAYAYSTPAFNEYTTHKTEAVDDAGWMAHNGGKQPVGDYVKVEVRYRDPSYYSNQDKEGVAGDFAWNHDSATFSDIMAYRKIVEEKKPDKQTYFDHWKSKLLAGEKISMERCEDALTLSQYLEREDS